MQTAQDLVYRFVDLYEAGAWLEALQTLIPTPNVQYDLLRARKEITSHSQSETERKLSRIDDRKSVPISNAEDISLQALSCDLETSPASRMLTCLINYADASAFEWINALTQTVFHLEEIINASESSKVLYQSFMEEVKKHFIFCLDLGHSLQGSPNQRKLPQDVEELFSYLREGYLKHEKRILDCLQKIDLEIAAWLAPKLPVIKGWELLKQHREELAKLMEEIPMAFRMPSVPFAYRLDPLPLAPLEKGEVGLIWLEPLQGVDYVEYLLPARHTELILLIENKGALYQLLQFPSIHTLIGHPNVYFYILEKPCADQFLVQHYPFASGKVLKPLFMLDRPLWKQLLPQLLKAFTLFVSDPTQSAWLNALTKKVLFQVGAERYGKSRFIAYSQCEGLKSWFSPKLVEKLPENADLGPPYRDLMQELITDYQAKSTRRPYAPKTRIKLTHVVPQIVGGGHAPTRILTTLCTEADHSWFELSVLSSERIAEHKQDYPSPTYQSASSLTRAGDIIQAFDRVGIKVLVDDASHTLEKTVENLTKALSLLQTDIVVFHGPDELNQLISASCDVPIRVFFEHGTPPPYGCFDLLILGTKEAYQQSRERYRKMGMESCYLPFGIDVTKDWLPSIMTKQQLGFPEEAFIMTTISNHLDNRLSHEMCHAIGQILSRCSWAYYAPMGEIKHPKRCMDIFKQYGVEGRVKFMGSVAKPSHVARSMQLYLNEFPFGSGIALLDALAAGCPIVSMYDAQGLQQSRYAATFFGIDRVIQSGKMEDYVELACALINDQEMYQEWSKHAIEMYRQQVDTQDYVQKFELILDKFIAYLKQAGAV